MNKNISFNKTLFSVHFIESTFSMAAKEYPFRHQSTFYAYELINTAAAQQNVKNTKDHTRY